jgi:hypothetical protein
MAGEATGRRIVTPAPATVRWRWAADEITAPRAEVTTPPAPGTGPPPLPDLRQPGELLATGVVTRLHGEVYARLPYGRLVLIGGPGAGKTGAMILLLPTALDHRRACLAGDQRERVPVPVWLTLGGWNPETRPLQDWAVGTMNRDYPALRASDYGPDAAGELLRGGRVALFLDGLDEMPEGARPLALKCVDEEARGLRVVVTSRPEEYRSAVQAGRPDNTAVIELRPVRPRWAADYLLHGQTEPSRQRWEQVGAYLTHNPDSIAARALDNPLTLPLARDTYTSQDPAVLTDPSSFPTVEAVREYLIDHFLITAYPKEHERATPSGGWPGSRTTWEPARTCNGGISQAGSPDGNSGSPGGSRPGSRPGSGPGSGPGSRPGSGPSLRARRRRLFRDKNAYSPAGSRPGSGPGS